MDGAGEGASLVAEELALEQSVGEGGAVDRDELATLAPPLEVDRPRAEFLAGPGFAVEQDGRVVLGESLDLGEDLVHARVARDHVRERIPLGELSTEVVDLVDEAALLENLLRREQDLLGLEGLRDVIRRSDLDRLDGALNRRVLGHHDDVDLRPTLADIAHQVKAVRVADAEVDEGERVVLPLEGRDRTRAVGSAIDQRPPAPEDLSELAPDRRVVVDDEHPGFHAAAYAPGHLGPGLPQAGASDRRERNGLVVRLHDPGLRASPRLWPVRLRRSGSLEDSRQPEQEVRA